MACLPRSTVLLLLLAACAGGADDGGGLSNAAGFGSNPSAVSQSSAPATEAGSDGMSSTGADVTGRPTGEDTGRPTTTDDVPPTTDPDATTAVDPSTTGGEDSSTGEPVVLCGNGQIDEVEECDGVNLNMKTCMTFGFTGGALTCTPQCAFDKSMCTSPSCGDGTVDMGEECDCGNQGLNCTALQLANKMCINLPSPKGTNFTGGTLSCNSPNSCSYNKAACIYCGDGVRNGGEACDGADLAGQTCNGLGFNGGGALACNADCTHNTGGCMNIVCGAGGCQPGEDSCNCPQDCPDDPNSCSPCQCGASGGACFCDAACIQFGDCCANGPC
jgi:hypothetical protein